MKGIHDFIVEITEQFSEKYKTAGGLELYVNKDISAERVSQRIAKVINIPYRHETVIKIGYEVLIDPSILYQQIYQGKKQDSIHIVDKEKGWFKLAPKEIILYRKDKSEDWTAYLSNNLVEPIDEKKEELKSSIIIIPDSTKTQLRDRAKAVYVNDELGCEKGDLLAIVDAGIPYWMEGKEYWWVRNSDVVAILS